MTTPLVGSDGKVTEPIERRKISTGLRDKNLVVEAPPRTPEIKDWPSLESIVAAPLERVALAGGSNLKYTREAHETVAESQGIGRIGYVFATGLVALVAILIASAAGYSEAGNYFAMGLVAMASIFLAAQRLRNIGGTGGSAWAMILPPVGVLIFLFCLFAPENYIKSGKLDAPAFFVLGLIAVTAVVVGVRYFA